MPDIIDSLKHYLCSLHDANVEVIETHISWVLLTGKIVYKIKKPVDLGFVDFTTLEKRKFYCFEELRLNKRLAPELYIDVAAITQNTPGLTINGNGPTIDYAVRLHQFDHEKQLDVLLDQQKLTLEQISELAEIVANFHRTAKRATMDSAYGQPAVVLHTSHDNFHHCRELVNSGRELQVINELDAWNNAEFSRVEPQLLERKRQGFIRECHGDLHLGNIAIYKNKITPFDCIEFNPDFRWIDVISEVAFLVMDLFARGRPDLAARFLNDYLTYNGDYESLGLLRFYLVYRAMVRAKVEIIRSGQSGEDKSEKLDSLAHYSHYVKLANQFSQVKKPVLLITHGLSGSGKTTIVKQLSQHWFAIHLRSDVERKRLFNLQATDKSESSVDQGIYSKDASEKTYTKLYTLADDLLRNHWNVIVDATFIKQEYRKKFQQLANEHQAGFVILDCRADKQTLQQRITSRASEASAISEANLQVLERQIESGQSFSNDELPYVITVDTEQALDMESLVSQITHPGA